MKITEVRIFEKESEDRKLRAFATITFDHCFVVRDIKIIEGTKGCFVAMPSRRIKEPCPRCRHRNVIHSKYCNQCGANLETNAPPPRFPQGPEDRLRNRQSEHRDIAHPINAEFREEIQRTVMQAYGKYKENLPKEGGSFRGAGETPGS